MSTKTLEKECPGCGRTITAEMPDDVLGAESLEDLFNSAIVCEECEEKRQEQKRKGTPEQRRRRFFELVRGVGLPENMIGWDESLGNNELLADIWGNRAKSLWVAGEHRTGKTRSVARAAAVMLWNEELSSSQVLYWRMPDLRKHLARLAGSDDNRAEQQEYQQLGRVELLILDDLDKGSMTDAGLEALYRIVDDRVAHPYAATWVTANTGSRDLLNKWIGEQEHRRETAVAITSRLREICYPVEVKEPSPAF